MFSLDLYLLSNFTLCELLVEKKIFILNAKIILGKRTEKLFRVEFY